jgi:PadR family transcriptional regulator PadR
MVKKTKLTYATSLVLQAIDSGYKYGFDIMDVSGLPDGTVYPALRRLADRGMLSSEWEDRSDAHDDKRPPRRYYELTPEGSFMLAEARAKFRGISAAILSQGGAT